MIRAPAWLLLTPILTPPFTRGRLRDLQAVHMMGSSLFGLDRNAAPLLWRLLAAVLQSLGRLEDAV